MTENLDSEQSRRLWEYRLHVGNQLYSRLTFFLIFESVLLGVVGALYSKTSQSALVLKVIVILGFCITVVWLYIQHNIKQSFVVMENRAKENFPEHKESINEIRKVRKVESRLGIEAPATILLTYVIPSLVALVWIFLLFFL
jgi:hypothetical protein